MKRLLKNNQTHEMYTEGKVCRRTNRMKDVQSQVIFWVLWEILLTSSHTPHLWNSFLPVLGVHIVSGGWVPLLTFSPTRPCKSCQLLFMAPSCSAKSVLSLRLLSTSWLLICSTDWFTKSAVSCLQFRSILKPLERDKGLRQCASV